MLVLVKMLVTTCSEKQHYCHKHLCTVGKHLKSTRETTTFSPRQVKPHPSSTPIYKGQRLNIFVKMEGVYSGSGEGGGGNHCFALIIYGFLSNNALYSVYFSFNSLWLPEIGIISSQTHQPGVAYYYIKIKISLNFHFHTSLRCLKSFYEGL